MPKSRIEVPATAASLGKASPPMARHRPAASRVAVPKLSAKRFYGHGIPGVDLKLLTGKLIVVEGADGSGRSTQIARVKDWLEGHGHATLQIGLKHSALIGEELDKAQDGNVLSRTTFSLFYATDFADQLENLILPKLRAGFMVLADRYIYTLMVRDLVRGMDEAWVRNIYSIALVPDAVFYLEVPPEQLVQRTFLKKHALDYWESGMDMALSQDMFDSFLKYQALVAERFRRLESEYGFTILDGSRPVDAVTRDLQRHIETVLAGQP